MDKLQHYINHNQCVSLPQRDKCDYLRTSNYLSEYQTQQDKQKVLDNLGISDLVEELYNNLISRFDSYATLKFLDDNFVKKIDLYYPEEEDDEDGFDPIGYTGDDSSSFTWKVDDFLSLTSINPVQNRIITAALNKKLDISALDSYLSSYVKFEQFTEQLKNYQRVLTAGRGIKIEGNTISATLDLNPFVVVNSLPTSNINPNKIYLVKSPGTNTYIQYVYTQNGWEEVGRTNLAIDLSGYLTLEEADSRYAKKGEVVVVNEGGGTSGVTTQQVLNILNQVLGNYVKKSEVYTPDLWGNDNTSAGISIGDGGGSGGSTINPGVIDWSQYINITVDNAITASSFNPVTSRAIYNALELKQNKLSSSNAGNGISISSNGVISCTLDTSIYKFVEILPITGDPNKIYLLSQGGTDYKQYVYNNGWKLVGTIDLGVDITNYLTKDQASEIYMSANDIKTYYLSKKEFNEYWTNNNTPSTPTSGTYATQTWVQDYVTELLQGMEFPEVDSGNYISLLTQIAKKANIDDVYNKEYIDSTFQKKINDYVKQVDFNSEITRLNGKIDAFTIDASLSSVSKNAVQNKVIYSKLQEKLSTTEASEIYLTKEEFQNMEIPIGSPLLKTINGQSLIGSGNIQIQFPVDSTVTNDSINSVSGRAVYNYVTDYVPSYVIDYVTDYITNHITGYATTDYVDNNISLAVAGKQNRLIAGNGIDISNNVISVLLDTNPFIIVDSRPTQNIQSNKIYLVKEQSGYRQWVYEDGQWFDKGLLDISVNLQDYVKRNEISNFVDRDEIANFVNRSEISTLVDRSEIADLVDSTVITNLRSWINNTFLKIEDVYTPNQGDTASGDISDDSGSGSGSSGSGSILPPSGNDSGSSSGGSVYYQPTNIQDGVKTNIAVGNINANTDVSTLRGLSFTEILTKILFRESYTNPNYSHFISIDTTQTVVEVGEVMETPTVVANWNSNITPIQTITKQVFVRQNGGDAVAFYPGSIYNDAGTYVFILNYSYPAGSYVITSNFGNERTYTVPAVSSSITKTVKATYPWYINNIKQTTLVPISQSHEAEIFLTGSPSVAIPGANSICNIQADLGLGYMDVSWVKTNQIRNGITYSIWTKPDSYLQEVKHKITFTIYL